MQQFMEFFQGEFKVPEPQKYNKPGPETAKDSREMRKIIRRLQFNPQNTLKFLKLKLITSKVEGVLTLKFEN